MTCFYERKLYGFFQDPLRPGSDPSTAFPPSALLQNLTSFTTDRASLDHWWQTQGYQAAALASASDRLNLTPTASTLETPLQELRHPLSGQPCPYPANAALASEADRAQRLNHAFSQLQPDPNQPDDPWEKRFWWAWRFYPEQLGQNSQSDPSSLLYPAHRILPDNPLPSYSSTVSALTGSLFPTDDDLETPNTPYLLIFTFSPVQDFIKASRKFLDFWAGSYLLHYLSAQLCWEIALRYGPDAVITPSLWGQTIIDALLVQRYPDFASFFGSFSGPGNTPQERFQNSGDLSLVTAGFPNTITALVPGQDAALALGEHLKTRLRELWSEIGLKVRDSIKARFVNPPQGPEPAQPPLDLAALWTELVTIDESSDRLPGATLAETECYQREFLSLRQGGCWEWNKLWEAQLNHTWEAYFAATPLGDPTLPLVQSPQTAQGNPSSDSDLAAWITAQNQIARPPQALPTPAEVTAFRLLGLNVGTWYGSLQRRLGQSLQAIKNTRRWQIPVAPGERSSLSGQYSALHPRLNYGKYPDGRGMSAGSLRLFWQAMAAAFPGLFDGTEKLNALELTKRMAWQYGGVAQRLGLRDLDSVGQAETSRGLDYDQQVRFPNLPSLASADFLHQNPAKAKRYWYRLNQAILTQEELQPYHDRFAARTRRPTQVPQADRALNPNQTPGEDYNGVMFSPKWLGEDLELNGSEQAVLRREMTQILNQEFGQATPADWVALVLADGDSMGQYVTGRRLKPYGRYVIEEAIDPQGIAETDWQNLLHHTRKRMGPATHVGLNRALLDFSNRLVPYLTQDRCGGRVIYSGGDDVMAAVPVTQLFLFLRSIQAAWSGATDPLAEFTAADTGYWLPPAGHPVLPHRPLFTMGVDATLSIGIVIAHKSVPLPTMLQNLWEAEADRAKKLSGTPAKNGLCFRIIYGSGNTSEALLKGSLLETWWQLLEPQHCNGQPLDLSPVLQRLATELPNHVPSPTAGVFQSPDPDCSPLHYAAQAILNNRDRTLPDSCHHQFLQALAAWEHWANTAQPAQLANTTPQVPSVGVLDRPLGTRIQDLANLLQFSAFWQRWHWQWERMKSED